MKYLLLSRSDADILSGMLIHALKGDVEGTGRMGQIAKRMRDDTGGDFEEIAALLKKQDLCGACVIEGMESHCASLDAQKLGRRLQRLIERAVAT